MGWLTYLASASLFWIAFLLTCEAGEVRYRVIKLIEGDGMSVPEPGGLNQKGQVVGSFDGRGDTRFWRWTDGVREDLPIGNGKAGLAAGINDLGQVVGSFQTGDWFVDVWGDVHLEWRAFVWTEGVVQDLGTFGGFVSFGLSINDQGVAVGVADTEGDERIPFIAQNGQKRSLASLVPSGSGWKFAVETHYVAADGRIWGLGTYGSRERIYEMTPETNGMYRIASRGVLEGLDLRVYGLNEYADAVGMRIASDGAGAFLWEGRSMILLGYPEREASYAYGVNNVRQAVGMYYLGVWRAFLWENGTMSDLNELIPPDSGIVLTKAKAINDAGSILCVYARPGPELWIGGVCLLLPVNPPPLKIARCERLQDGVRLEVCGGAGQPLTVEYTGNWSEWTVLATSTNLIGRRIVVDPNPPAAAFRAYRARIPGAVSTPQRKREPLRRPSAF